MLRSLTGDQFWEWMAYEELEPFGELRDDYRMANTMQLLANLQRDPKVALHIESGATYDTLKGVLIRGVAELVHDEELVFQTLRRVHEKMSGAFPDAAGVEDVMRWQARKRVALKITPRRVSSWDHAKLGGGY